ncbi:hypothetical protein ACFFLM_00710 [Deinococcus oregonensis]|uniref:Uncharacterized protein n=1 Tax=Deinococcus oregonensis TaxID=1805970 RepID=A0ABV6ASM6_9DEIO
MNTRAAALTFTAATGLAVAFQLALAAGAPWGAYAMGGAYPGQFSPPLRVVALVQSAFLSGMAGVVLARADVALPDWSRAARRLIWGVVAISALSLVMNLATPSATERALWGPIALVLLVSSAWVALRQPAGHQA